MAYLLPYVLLVVFRVSIGNGQQIEVRYSSLDVEGQILPDLVNVTLTTDTNTTHLQLNRVEYIDLDIPLYSLSVDSNGTFSQRRERSRNRKNIGYYQDVKSQAVFQLTRTNSVRERKSKLTIMGEFKQSDEKYFVKPDVTSTEQATTTTSSPLDKVVYKIKQNKKRPASFMDYAIPPPEVSLTRRHRKMTWARKNQPLNASSDQSPPPKRDRRAADSTYYIDVIAVVDYAAYSRFYRKSDSRTKAIDNIREYYAFIFNGIDLLYQGITTAPYKIRVRLNKIFVAETPSSSKFTTDYSTQGLLDADKGLLAFRSFVGASDLLQAYDHAMLFTGYNLKSADSGTSIIGYAYLGTMCRTDGSSTSIIEDMADYQASNTAAHELGHSLSAQHDGVSNRCTDTSRYIMAASTFEETPDTMYNPWQFSSCSVQYFTKFIEEQLNTIRGYYCLTKVIPIDQEVPYAGDQLPGQMYTPDQQCQMIYGATSNFCRSLYLNDTEGICRSMYCVNPENASTCVSLTNVAAVRGTTCGNGKICINGRCVIQDGAPQADETCMYGDQPGRSEDFSSCQAQVANFNGYCYRDNVRAKCCSSCKAVRKTIRNCEYDDYYDNCDTSDCLSPTLKMQCCKTCKSGVAYTTRTTKSTPKTTTAKICVDNPAFTFSGKQCASLAQNWPSMCDEVEVKRACCVSCQKVNTTVDACLDDTEFRYNGQTCSSAVRNSRAVCNDKYFEQVCCMSCQHVYTTVQACLDDTEFRYNGQTCSSAVRNSRSLCKYSDFAQICCKSCHSGSGSSKVQVPVLLVLMITSLVAARVSIK
ncbi:A disintegrin and metalloproteinase with thrombospondin motifs 6-like [Physella acuta]|uniref:A disintegrin and metalloproteinase with thrombospondin motifs 6-like n=1 Tax=Physella acuta TaxID=109671 RepID=UPI0027DE130D|nr:A disintegrin and metalloproteinase with thrombospondin motifs 6-like [Physella acuta]